MHTGFENSDKYSEKEYWDERYRHEESFDWFVRYESFRSLVQQNVLPSDKILNLGCGNSLLPLDMYMDGYRDILNIDYSSVIIEEMRTRHMDLPEMTWGIMGIRDMSELSDETFDVIIEKGTLDSLLVTERNPWCLSDDAEYMMDEVISEFKDYNSMKTTRISKDSDIRVRWCDSPTKTDDIIVSRLLKPGGRFISVTFAQPHFRLPLFAREKYDWSTKTDTIGEYFHYFFYTMRKGEVLDDKEKTLRTEYVNRKTKSYDVIPVSESEDEDFLLRSDWLINDDNIAEEIR